MSAFTVVHSYAARRDGLQFGPWAEGEIVQVDDADAEWVNRDSPGTLEPEPPGKAERQQPASADRQHRGSRNRSA